MPMPAKRLGFDKNSDAKTCKRWIVHLQFGETARRAYI